MFVLDTNVVSELRKIRHGRAHPRVVAWSASVLDWELFLSAVTVHELEIGILRKERSDPVQGALFRRWLDDFLLPAFEGRVLPVDAKVARLSAAMHVPGPMPVIDSLIAATALPTA